MKTVLINPPWYFADTDDKVISQNLAIGYLAGFLMSHNIETAVIDSLIEGFDNHIKVNRNDKECIQVGLSYADICKKIPPDTTHVGITVPFSHLAPICGQLARAVKEYNSTLKVIVGGVFPSTFPEQALTDDIDYVIRGEGEQPLLDLLKGKDPAEIAGLVYKENGTIRNNGVAVPIADLDDIPLPARNIMPVEKYFALSPRMASDKKTISMVTSRGCPFDCNFCSVHPVYGYKWRSRSPSNVLSEIKQAINDYDIEHIEFEDDNLTLNRNRAAAIFDGMIDLKKEITWSAHNGVRIDTLDRDLIKKMKRSGCTRLNLAIESGNEKMLKEMNKKLSLEKVTEMVRCCCDENIHTTGFLLVGYPGETKESFAETLAFFKKLLDMGLGGVAPFIVNPYPGTKLYENCKRNNYLSKQIDIDHFFSISNTDDILITTDSFSKDTAALWYELANNINRPYIAYAKRFIKKYIPKTQITRIKSVLERLKKTATVK